MSLKIYTVKKAYTDYLHKIDNKVLLEHPGGKTRKFIGIILTINNQLYCIPFSSPDYIIENSRRHVRRSFFPVILRLFDTENGERKFYGKLLFNNMIPVTPSAIDAYILKTENDIPYKNLVTKQYNIIRSEFKKGNINKYITKLYTEKINNINKGYIEATVDFTKLEEGCKLWAFNHMLITNRDALLKDNIYYCGENFNPQNVVNIVNGTYSKCKGFDNTKPALQEITIYAKDEFGQEKSTQLFVKVTPPNSGDNNNISIEKEAVGV